MVNIPKNITFGETDILKEDVLQKNIKLKITTYLDGDVVDELKKRAEIDEIDYRDYLNLFLRNNLIN